MKICKLFKLIRECQIYGMKINKGGTNYVSAKVLLEQSRIVKLHEDKECVIVKVKEEESDTTKRD